MLLSSLLTLSAVLLLVEAKCYRGYESKYSFDVGAALHPAWMANIPDAINFTSLSVPGTHDSLTYDIRDQVFQCQNRNLSTQLRAGLRYFDVRARLVDNELQIYHGGVFTGYSYATVLLTLFGFLDENPSEAIVMRLKEEGSALGNTTMNFEQAFNFYKLNASDTAPGCTKHFFAPETFNPLPTLGSLRSKILILQNFGAAAGGTPYGIGWDSSSMILEDLWEVQDPAHLYLKWDAIRSALDAAATNADDNSALYLSHLSASEDILPIEAAAGTLDRSVVGMNDMTGEYLTGTGSPAGRTGVVIIDFPGQQLVDAVLERNRGLTV